MSWWNPFKAIANAVIDAVSTVIEKVADAFDAHELGQKIAGVFESVAETVVDVVVDIAVGVATSTPVQAVVNVVVDIAEGATGIYDALNPAGETEVAALEAPEASLDSTANYGSDDMLM